MIYDLHKFLKKFFLQKRIWRLQSHDFQERLPQNVALE